MNLFYIANVRLPTEKAHGIQIIKMCEALALNDVEVVLLVPYRFKTKEMVNDRDIFSFYNVKHNFTIRYLPNFDILFLARGKAIWGTVLYLIQEMSFSLFAFKATMGFRGIVYSRDKVVAFLRGLTNLAVVFEAHDGACRNWFDRLVARKSKTVVGVSLAVVQSWKELGAQTVYAPDGVSEEFFNRMSTNQARKKLGLPLKQKIAVYTGSLYSWKGTDIIFRAAKLLPKIHFYVVGGSEVDTDVEGMRKNYAQITNCQIVGYRPYREMSLWMKAADVLVLTGSRETRKGWEETSPLKLFEYMAVGKPIVAAETPAIREIMSVEEVWFYKPEDIRSLVRQLQRVLKVKSSGKVEKAWRKARQYRWEKRASKIIKALNDTVG